MNFPTSIFLSVFIFSATVLLSVKSCSTERRASDISNCIKNVTDAGKNTKNPVTIDEAERLCKSI